MNNKDNSVVVSTTRRDAHLTTTTNDERTFPNNSFSNNFSIDIPAKNRIKMEHSQLQENSFKDTSIKRQQSDGRVRMESTVTVSNDGNRNPKSLKDEKRRKSGNATLAGNMPDEIDPARLARRTVADGSELNDLSETSRYEKLCTDDCVASSRRPTLADVARNSLDSSSISLSFQTESPPFSPRQFRGEDRDGNEPTESDAAAEDIDSGRSSLLGSSRQSILLDEGADEQQAEPTVNKQDTKALDSYNGKFYSSGVNRRAETGSSNELNYNDDYNNTVAPLRERANTKVTPHKKSSRSFVENFNGKRKNKSSSELRERRMKSFVEHGHPTVDKNNSNIEYYDEMERTQRKATTASAISRYFKRKMSAQPTAKFYSSDDVALGRKGAERPSTSAAARSATCHANSSLSLNWRKFIRTLSGEIAQQKGEKPSAESLGARHGANLNREWEVVTVQELCRRLSLKDSLEPSEMPLPKGALQSLILDEFMIRQIIDILPPRAEGYSWVNIYSSEKHGFSLSTLYRKMSEWTEEMSPVLLVIRDVNSHVFGAVASTALRPSEHYYGTGDSCLLFRFTGEYPHTRELRSYKWTGDNQFFVNATRNFLAMGGGSGHYGLWLDSDLNHGRSQRCATFDNEPLAGSTTSAGDVTPVALVDADNGNFIVQYIEAFGFSMS